MHSGVFLLPDHLSIRQRGSIPSSLMPSLFYQRSTSFAFLLGSLCLILLAFVWTSWLIFFFVHMDQVVKLHERCLIACAIIPSIGYGMFWAWKLVEGWISWIMHLLVLPKSLSRYIIQLFFVVYWFLEIITCVLQLHIFKIDKLMQLCTDINVAFSHADTYK